MLTVNNSNTHLDDLVNEPREALDIEVKEWLDLTTKDHRAMLAKEIIALANHGGGYVVIGFKEGTDGTFEPPPQPPPDLGRWSQDTIQDIVAKYVDPGVQCRVVHRERRQSGQRHPVIVVPGGLRVPVRAKAGSPDGKTLFPHRIYIRRPGPCSEEPRSAEEWDRFFERCLQNRKAELLEAMRSIIQGVIPTAVPPTPTRADELAKFERQAIARWEFLVTPLSQNAPPRLVHGYYDVSFAIDGEFDRKSLGDLRDIIRSEVRNHSGWPPFLTIDRLPFTPKPVDRAVEFWRGPDADGLFNTPDHHDFWRISPDGLLFTRRGYSEDGRIPELSPGAAIAYTLPIRRFGEAVLEAGYIARALIANQADLLCHSRWTGLSGRALSTKGNPHRLLPEGRYSATQDEYKAVERVAVAALPDALPELVFRMLAPFYELFDFFKLPKRVVEDELASLRRSQF